MRSDSRAHGFTIVELILVLLIFTTTAFILLWQQSSLSQGYRDDQKKTDINAIYYGLEESFYKENGYYPLAIKSERLRTVDAARLKDPDGNMIGSGASSYRYQPERCDQDRCQGFTLSADLEREASFVKRSRAAKKSQY